MQQVSVKIDDDVYQELEEQRGTENKSVFFRKLINTYFKMGEYQDLQKKYGTVLI